MSEYILESQATQAYKTWEQIHTFPIIILQLCKWESVACGHMTPIGVNARSMKSEFVSFHSLGTNG